jgi:nucleoid-associated protein YgaU
LSKISKHFYGDPDEYATIVKANNIAGRDKIEAGQPLIIPAA